MNFIQYLNGHTFNVYYGAWMSNNLSANDMKCWKKIYTNDIDVKVQLKCSGISLKFLLKVSNRQINKWNVGNEILSILHRCQYTTRRRKLRCHYWTTDYVSEIIRNLSKPILGLGEHNDDLRKIPEFILSLNYTFE